MRPNFDEAIYFARILGGLLTFQIFPDRKNAPSARIFHHHSESPYLYAFLRDVLSPLNKQGAGVYVSVSETDGRGRKSEHVVRIRAWFVDYDEGEKEEFLNKLRSSPLPPSIVVETRRGVHAYWLADEGASVSNFARIQAGLIRAFNGDPKAKDVARVLRMPGFYHCKEDPFLVRIVYASEVRYYEEEMDRAYPPPPSHSYIPERRDYSSFSYSSGRGSYSILLELKESLPIRWRNGSRHQLALAAAARLYRAGIPQEEAEDLIRWVAWVSGDTEVEDRVRAVRDTYRKGSAGLSISARSLREVGI